MGSHTYFLFMVFIYGPCHLIRTLDGISNIRCIVAAESLWWIIMKVWVKIRCNKGIKGQYGSWITPVVFWTHWSYMAELLKDAIALHWNVPPFCFVHFERSRFLSNQDNLDPSLQWSSGPWEPNSCLLPRFLMLFYCFARYTLLSVISSLLWQQELNTRTAIF